VDQAIQKSSICKVPPASVCNAQYGTSIGRGAFAWSDGNWNKVEQIVTLNTLTGSIVNANGQIQVWMNDQLVIDYRSIIWRTMEHVGFQGIQWDSFFGGNDDSWATPTTQYVFFKNATMVILK
jgi:hypothetical protein